jgi:RNA polymerase primary sigma factor
VNADAPVPPQEEGLPVEEIGRLISMGRIAGSVTVDEVLVAMGSPDPTPEFIGAITELLSNQGISVDPEEPVEELAAGKDVEEVEAIEAPRARRALVRRAPRERPMEAQRAGSSADPVRMYLKEIGRVPLLSGPEEVSLAKRIEAGAAARERLDEIAGQHGDDVVAERARLDAC